VTDLIVKAKQVEYLIKSLPEPEPEEEQVKHRLRTSSLSSYSILFDAVKQRNAAGIVSYGLYNTASR